MNPTVDASEVLRQLNQMYEMLPERTFNAVEKASLAVESASKRNATGVFKNPSGILKSSITHLVAQEVDSVAGYVGSGLFYAPFVHEGTGIYAPLGRKNVPWHYKDNQGNWHTTSGIRPHPFMADAVQTETDNILNFFKEVFGVIEN